MPDGHEGSMRILILSILLTPGLEPAFLRILGRRFIPLDQLPIGQKVEWQATFCIALSRVFFFPCHFPHFHRWDTAYFKYSSLGLKGFSRPFSLGLMGFSRPLLFLSESPL